MSSLSHYAGALVAKGEGEHVRDASRAGEHAPWTTATFEGNREWNDKGFDAFQVTISKLSALNGGTLVRSAMLMIFVNDLRGRRLVGVAEWWREVVKTSNGQEKN